jgi:hypothetical protein
MYVPKIFWDLDAAFGRVHSRILDLFCKLTGGSNYSLARLTLNGLATVCGISLALALAVVQENPTWSIFLAGWFGLMALFMNIPLRKWLGVMERWDASGSAEATISRLPNPSGVLLRVAMELIALWTGLIGAFNAIEYSSLLAWWSTFSLVVTFTGIPAIIYFTEDKRGTGKRLKERLKSRIAQYRLQFGTPGPQPTST